MSASFDGIIAPMALSFMGAADSDCVASAELTGLDDANLEPQRATIARSGDDLRRNPGVIQLNVYTMHVSQARPRALPQGHVDLMPASIIEHGVGHNAVVGLNA